MPGNPISPVVAAGPEWKRLTPERYQGQVRSAARALRISPDVVAAQLWTESRFKEDALSPAGAEGLAQFEPGTWSELGCGGSPDNPDDAFRCYTTYMHQLLAQEHGNVRNALAAYNAGPGNLAAGYGYADSVIRLAAGKTPPGSVTPRSAGGGGGGPNPDCLWQVNFNGAQVLGFHVGPSLHLCLLSKSAARAAIGAALLTVGAMAMLP